MPIMPPWANNHDTANLQAKTVPMNLIWSELVKRLLSYGIRKVWDGRTNELKESIPYSPFFPSEREGDKKNILGPVKLLEDQ